MNTSQRESVKVLLFNTKKQLLLIHTDDPKTQSSNGQYHGSFWSPIGGGVELNETLREAAHREVFEETGITLKESELGSMVWFGEFDLILHGVLTHIKQTYFVAKTDQSTTSLSHLMPEEKAVVQKLAWFSLEEIQNSREVIFPVVLPEYLPDILAERYPNPILKLDLAKQPSPRKI